MTSDNPFASPRSIVEADLVSSGNSLNAWRSDNLLVVGKNAQLPDRCIKCNAPALEYRRRFSMSWHTPWAYLGLLGGLLPYLILAIALQKKLKFEAGVCAIHRRRRRIGIAVGLLGSIASVAMMVAGGMSPPRSNQVLLILVGPIFLLVSLLAGISISRIVSPKRIDKQHAWIKGVSAAYLDELPVYPRDLE